MRGESPSLNQPRNHMVQLRNGYFRSMLNSRRGPFMVLLVLGCATTAFPAEAQWRVASSFPPHPEGIPAAQPHSPIAARQQRPTELLVLGGVLGGGIGLVGGAFAGAGLEIAAGCDHDYCGIAGGLLGAMAGEIILLPLGVHLANGRQGNYGYALLASAGSAAGGLLLSLAAGALTGEEGIDVVLWAIPVAQLASSIVVERRTSRSSL